MKLYLKDIKTTKKLLLYEQAFLHFLKFKNILNYFTVKVPKQTEGISAPIYRSIIHNTKDFSDKYITQTKYLSYRPKEDVKYFGRINRPFQTYFYASGEGGTCMKELETRIHKELEFKNEICITTSQWNLQKDLTIIVIPDWDNKELCQFIDVIEKMKLSPIEINILTGINELFREEDENTNIYQVTSAFCNCLLYDTISQKINIDGFLYTSVKNGVGYNFALLNNLVDNQELILRVEILL